jgi:hypothetical protein
MACSPLGFLELRELSDRSKESQLRRALVVTVTTAVGVTLLSCSEVPRPANQSSTISSMGYDSAAPVVRAPLAPPVGYSSPSPLTYSPTPPVPRANSDQPTTGLGEWRASPRWAAVQGEGCIEVEPDPRAQAEKLRVETCPKNDVGEPFRGEEFGVPPE